MSKEIQVLGRRQKVMGHLLGQKPAKYNWQMDAVGPVDDSFLRHILSTTIQDGETAAEEMFRYDDTFKDALRTIGQTSIRGLLIERKKLGKTNHLLDIFGGGYFSDTDVIDSVSAMRLPDRSESSFVHEYKKLYAEANILGDTNLASYFSRRIAEMERILDFPQRGVLYQNGYDVVSWIRLKENLISRGIPEIDIATFRPEGGIYRNRYMRTADHLKLVPLALTEFGVGIKHNEKLFQPYVHVFYRMFLQTKMLLGENGIILGQIPHNMPASFVDRFQRIVQAQGDGTLEVFPPRGHAHMPKMATFIYQK